jgi:outer membrane protein OmpA-like peptidoglycan-associated protein
MAESMTIPADGRILCLIRCMKLSCGFIFEKMFFNRFMRVFFGVWLLLGMQTLYAQRPGNDSFRLVNSPYDELNPVVSPDGKTLYVTISNHPQNIGGKKDQGDIWYSKLLDGNIWASPIHAGSAINSSGYNAVAGFSPSGDKMFLLGHYYREGSIPRTQGISVSSNDGSGWTKPQNIIIPYFQNKSTTLGGYILGQSTFVYAAETYGTRGVEDIYVSVKGSDGGWSAPKNLGGMINTQFQELSPSLSADGKTLYFSSNGRKGHGSFDIYASERLDDTWMNWSEPVNLGGAFNTEGRELFYRPYENSGYSVYASTKNSDGYGDIKIFLSDEPQKVDTTRFLQEIAVDTALQIVEVPRDPNEDKKVRVYGKVSNSKTGEFIAATVYFSAPHLSIEIAARETTGYSLSVPSTDEYAVRIESVGFVSIMEKLDINTYEMKELEMNFKLQPVEIGTTVNLKDVLFEQGKTTLLSTSYPELDLVVSFLKSNPKVRIELSGHTDNRGIPAQNVKLSQARVDKVKTYLVSKGIAGRRISGKGYGGAKPIASNDVEETRQLNRRVEFTIKKF